MLKSKHIIKEGLADTITYKNMEINAHGNPSATEWLLENLVSLLKTGYSLNKDTITIRNLYFEDAIKSYTIKLLEAPEQNLKYYPVETIGKAKFGIGPSVPDDISKASFTPSEFAEEKSIKKKKRKIKKRP